MSSFIFVGLFIVVAVSALPRPPIDNPEMRKKMVEAFEVCKASENPSPEDMEVHKKRQIPTSKEGKCFVGCLMENFGILKNGTFNRSKADEKVKKIFADNPDMLEKALQGNIECENEVSNETDRCESGPKVMNCFEKHHKKNM